MTFSTRVICNPPPPATPMVRALGAALWMLPVMISAVCLLAVPSKTGDAIVGMLKGKEQPLVLASAIIETPLKLEPERFARVAATPYRRTLLDVRPQNEPRFPMQLTLLEPEAEPQPASVQRFAEKMRIKVAAPKFPQRPPVDLAPVASLPETTAAAPPAALAETRVLRNAEALSANVISAEGVYIAIAGIDAPRQGETCRRLDGVEVDCRARAKARLAILLMDRKITCRLSEPQQNGIRQGRCTAGKIDIAGDLLRQGLARRTTASLATAAL